MNALATRAVLAMVTLVAISLVTFLGTNVLPADPARLALGRQATEEQLELFREQQGLDQPVVERYVSWLGAAISGDLGDSTRTRQPVTDGLAGKLARTLTLALGSAAIAIPLALILGAYLGRRSGKTVDLVGSAVGVGVSALPEFVVGILLLSVFSIWLGVLPIESSGAVYGDLSEQMLAYVLPTICLSLILVPYAARVFRANVRDTSHQPFVRSVVLRGLPERRVVRAHIAPNALVPSVHVLALSVAEVVAGSVVVETVFGFPGAGKEFVDAVLAKDIPSVQILTLVAAAAFVAMNLLADVIQVGLDPRLRVPGRR